MYSYRVFNAWLFGKNTPGTSLRFNSRGDIIQVLRCRKFLLVLRRLKHRSACIMTLMVVFFSCNFYCLLKGCFSLVTMSILCISTSNSAHAYIPLSNITQCYRVWPSPILFTLWFVVHCCITSSFSNICITWKCTWERG